MGGVGTRGRGMGSLLPVCVQAFKGRSERKEVAGWGEDSIKGGIYARETMTRERKKKKGEGRKRERMSLFDDRRELSRLCDPHTNRTNRLKGRRTH